jgi:hypothetical protein
VTTTSRFSFLTLSLLLVAAAGAVALFPSPRRAAPRWTVIVQDEHGRGIAGLPLSESWSEGLLVSSEATALVPTDAKGAVTFPPRTSWSCLLGSILQTVRSVLSFGLEAPGSAKVSMGSPSRDVGLVLEAEAQTEAAQARVVRKDDGSFVEVPW